MWGLVLDTDGKGERFHSCLIDASLPDDVQPYLRSCLPAVERCAAGWSDAGVERLCAAYTSLVFTTETYRNVHCAVCNGLAPSDLSCNSTSQFFRQIRPLDDFNPSAFALLFDMKDSTGAGVGQRDAACRQGQLYDPFARKCRQVYCPQVSPFAL